MTITLPWPFHQPESTDEADEYSQDIEANPKAPALQQPLASFLYHYTTPGKSPPSARVDPKIKVQEPPPVRLWHLWKYGLVAATKVTEMTIDILSHHIIGPRKKSWGIEMTLITSFMRGAARHSSLVDIGTIRMLMGIGGLVPLPSDALVTPVTFRVKRRQLRGILQQCDEAESGLRELSGEWVVGKKTWQRLQSEWKANQQKARQRTEATQSEGSSGNKPKTERVVLYIHGGAYYLSSAASQRLISIPLSKYLDARVFALDYRLAPETKFPGPLHDVVCGYFRLTDDLHIPPENIILAGDSAGGGLILALLMYLRDNRYPLPSGAILMSPWVDLTMSCQSWDENAPFDVVPMPAPDDHMNPIHLYLGDNAEQYLTHPYASPLFGDFTGLPPLLIQAGDAEVLRDEITLLAHKASLANVEVRHELYEDAIHVFQLYPFLAACTRSFMSMREFVRKTVPQFMTRSPQCLDEKILEPEIDNDAATVVRGDGVKIASGKEAAEADFEDSEVTEASDTDEEKLRKFPSWRRATSWSINMDEDDSSDSDESDTEAQTITLQSVPPTPNQAKGRSRADTMPPLNSFRRIQSALSHIVADANSSPPHRQTLHRRATSQIPSQVSTPRLPLLRMSSGYDVKNRPDSIQLPPQSAHFVPSLPPSPSIRRRSLNSSHPDLTHLVQSWTSSGPANNTVVFPTSGEA